MTYTKSRKYLPPEMYESWGGIFMPKKYEVLFKQTWVSAYRAETVGKSLHYKLYDSSEGVAKPGEWRMKGENAPKLQMLQIQEYNPDDDNILEI